MRPRSNEPIFWSLFGAGGFVTVKVTPAMILLTGILTPLGIFASAMAYDRVLPFARHWLGALFLFAVIALPLWHAMHRVHHLCHDLGLQRGLGFVKSLAYGLALLGTVVTGYYLVRL